MTPRNLDGIYIRAKVGTRYEARCLTDLPWETVEEWLKGQPDTPTLAINVAKHLHERLRKLGDELDISMG